MEKSANNMQFNKYPAYEDSGVEWLGKIPEHWSLGKLGTLLKPFSIKNRPDLPLLSITREEGVIERDIEDDTDNHNFIPDDLTGYKLIKKGQFGMNKMKAWQGSYGISPLTGIVSPAYYVFDFNNEINARFFHLAIRSKNYVAFFGQASDGVRIGQWDLSKTRMKEIPFFIPTYQEQTAIATFLDDKTAKIDKAIAQKEKMIALLKERKQIIIQNLVTGNVVWNIEKNAWTKPAKVKDSGVEWIGEIPEDWGVKRLGVFGLFSKGGGFSKSDLTESGCLAILYGDIYTKYEFRINKPVRYISAETAKKSIKIEKGDLLFTGSGETKEDIGKCVVLDFEGETYAGGDVIIFKQSLCDNIFLSYYLNTEIVKSEKAKTAKGEIIVHTYASKLKEIKVCLPPNQAQFAIIQHIENQSSKIDRAITLHEQQIEKLKEYKAVLIDAAVTGKIKVC